MAPRISVASRLVTPAVCDGAVAPSCQALARRHPLATASTRRTTSTAITLPAPSWTGEKLTYSVTHHHT
eukprot:5124709-Prymnesium_polylepis.1